MSRRRRGPLVVLLAALALAGWWFAWPTVTGAAFVSRAAGLEGPLAAPLQWTTGNVHERPLTIPWRGGQLRARAYLPDGSSDGAVLLVPGVHASGIDEPRLTRFAGDLASTGRTVVAAELPPLTAYRITPDLTDMIEDAAGWIAGQPTLSGRAPIGIAGISFAGGLSIVAASRPAIRGRVQYVLSFGGHGDLPRTLQYLCTGRHPDGAPHPPHDYGVAIILLGVAERLVPPAQAAPLKRGIEMFLEGSRLDMVDREAAVGAFARAREIADALPEPAASLLRAVNDRDVATLGPQLLPHVQEYGGDPALSPERSATPAATVYLLHGTDDNVIPAIESARLADHLRTQGAIVHRIATPLITHAEVDNAAAARDVWRLVRFWARLLAE